MTSSDDASDLFDGPSAWRAELIEEAGLRGAARRAAASTGVAMPQLLEPLARCAESAPAGPTLDVGGGLGPVSAWWRERTGRRSIVVDLTHTSCAAARRLFDVASVRARVEAIPFRDASASVVIANGVVSLLDELRPTIGELSRVVRPGGLVAVADITSAVEQRFSEGPNTFWSGEDVVVALRDAGMLLEDMACAVPGAGDWADDQSWMNGRIRQPCSGRAEFGAWSSDQRRIERLAENGRIVAASIVARRPA